MTRGTGHDSNMFGVTVILAIIVFVYALMTSSIGHVIMMTTTNSRCIVGSIAASGYVVAVDGAIVCRATIANRIAVSNRVSVLNRATVSNRVAITMGAAIAH
jgi:hypothetical protein